MGTNYYVELNVCEKCGRPEERIHVGKSSYGWKFMFNLNGKRYYANAKELKKWLAGKVITDEYGGRITAAILMHVVPLVIIPLVIARLLTKVQDERDQFTHAEQESMQKDIKEILVTLKK